jgi:hypothetical protein
LLGSFIYDQGHLHSPKEVQQSSILEGEHLFNDGRGERGSGSDGCSQLWRSPGKKR